MNTGTGQCKTLQGKKLLYILNVANRVNSFSYASILAAQGLEIEFHIAGNWSYVSEEEKRADENKYGIKIHQIDFVRTPYHPGNKRAYSQLKALVEKEKYDAIHCNTPIGGVLGRIVGKQCKVNKVLYQVHGFHFYKGAPKKNWLLYYPVEKWLARYTDALITINQEDYAFAKRKLKLRNNGGVCYVPGVGIDISKYCTEGTSREEKRCELNIPQDAFVFISAGELNANKNNSVIISALAQLKNSNIHYVLCGVGELGAELQAQVDRAGLQNHVHFLGYRNDITELYKMADCFVMPSIREGLSRSIMEAMASKLPVMCSCIRGNVDLIDEKGGVLFAPASGEDCKLAIETILQSDTHAMGDYNFEKVQYFSQERVVEAVQKIYKALLN